LTRPPGRPPIALATSLAAAALLACRSAAADDWLGADKALHFGASAAIAGGAYGAAIPIFEEPLPRAVAAGSAAVALGAGKELADLAGAGDPSWKDFAWDLVGAAVGVAVAVVLDVSLRGEDRESRGRSLSPLVARW
jgi:putative lipoprotein